MQLNARVLNQGTLSKKKNIQKTTNKQKKKKKKTKSNEILMYHSPGEHLITIDFRQSDYSVISVIKPNH